jgi:hypothetical protein
MSRLNFFQAAKVSKNTEAAKAKTPRQHGIIAVYVEKNGVGSFYAKLNNKKYPIENYKLSNGKVYSKPCNDAYTAWTMKEFGNEVTFDKYVILDRMWASLYDGQPITGRLQNGMFKLISKTDKLIGDV